MKSIVLVDIDGCLANDAWRRPLIAEQGWDAYFDKMGEDEMNPHVFDIVRSLQLSGATAIGTTGRPERYRQTTMTWLVNRGSNLDDLWMRADQDHGPAQELKLKLVEQHLGPGWPDKVLLIMDDNEKIVEAFRKKGVFGWLI